MAMEVLSTRLTVEDIDKGGKKFQKVSRAHMKSSNYTIVLDYHNILLPLTTTDTVDIVLYDGVVPDELVPQDYQYVMTGKVYKIVRDDSGVMTCSASFGGLCMTLTTESENIKKFTDFSDISIAVRKI
jgi:DNA-directed RNA polymerase I, II, and III subunit RPABC3